jgi:hypothetical protein
MSLLNKLNVRNPFKKEVAIKEDSIGAAPRMRPKKRGMSTSFSAHRLSALSHSEHQKFKRLSFNADCLINPNSSFHVKDCTLIPYKLLIIGDTGVGKSSLLSRFCDQVFMTNYVDTVGVDCKIKQISFKNDLNLESVPTLNSINRRHSELLMKSNRRSNCILNISESINVKLQV